MIRKVLYHFFVALAACSSCATLISFLWTINFSRLERVIFVIVVLALCAIYTFIQMRTKKRISISLNPKLKVNIFEGDLLESKDKERIIVIPFNEYFDTIVDDRIIAKRTIHGQFINKFFGNRVNELNTKINNALKREKEIDVNNNRENGNKEKYALGTCLDIDDGGNVYVLVAFTHFNEKNHAYINPDELKDIIYKVFTHISEMANLRPVYMPLMGTGQSGLNIPSQRLLLFYLEYIEFISPISLPEGLNIVIKSLSKIGVNLNNIEHFYKTF